MVFVCKRLVYYLDVIASLLSSVQILTRLHLFQLREGNFNSILKKKELCLQDYTTESSDLKVSAKLFDSELDFISPKSSTLSALLFYTIN